MFMWRELKQSHKFIQAAFFKILEEEAHIPTDVFSVLADKVDHYTDYAAWGGSEVYDTFVATLFMDSKEKSAAATLLIVPYLPFGTITVGHTTLLGQNEDFFLTMNSTSKDGGTSFLMVPECIYDLVSCYKSGLSESFTVTSRESLNLPKALFDIIGFIPDSVTLSINGETVA